MRYRDYMQNIEKDFNLDSLKRISGYLERELKEIQEDRAKLLDQVKKALEVTWHYEIFVERGRDYSTGNIKYHVSVHNIPSVEGGRKELEYKTCKNFKGTEKKQVREYIKEMEKLYRVKFTGDYKKLKL